MAGTQTHPVPIEEEILAAAREYRAGLVETDVTQANLKIRQSAEKAWLAVVDAVDKYIITHGPRVYPGPSSFEERATRLKEIAGREVMLHYRAIASELHGGCYYGGNCSDITVAMEEACQFTGDLLQEHDLCSAMSAILHPEQRRLP